MLSIFTFKLGGLYPYIRRNSLQKYPRESRKYSAGKGKEGRRIKANNKTKLLALEMVKRPKSN